MKSYIGLYLILPLQCLTVVRNATESEEKAVFCCIYCISQKININHSTWTPTTPQMWIMYKCNLPKYYETLDCFETKCSKKTVTTFQVKCY